MLDDPFSILGGVVLAGQSCAILYLLVSEWRKSWRHRAVDLATIMGSVTLLSYIWFTAWIVSGGLVPHGLAALGVGVTLVILTYVIDGLQRR